MTTAENPDGTVVVVAVFTAAPGPLDPAHCGQTTTHRARRCVVGPQFPGPLS